MTTFPMFTAYLMRGLVHEKWRFFLFVSFVALALACWPNSLAHLRYERSALMDDEVWRIMTAHFVHLNIFHLLLNLLGLMLICELQWGELPFRHGLGLLGFSAATISALLWWLHPELAWYAGLSGTLHGLWAGCALYGLCFAPNTLSQSRFLYLGGILLLLLKLLAESHFGASAITSHLIGGNVATVSHLYGAEAGIAYVLTWRYVKMPLLSEGRCDRIHRPGSET